MHGGFVLEINLLVFVDSVSVHCDYARSEINSRDDYRPESHFFQTNKLSPPVTVVLIATSIIIYAMGCLWFKQTTLCISITAGDIWSPIFKVVSCLFLFQEMFQVVTCLADNDNIISLTLMHLLSPEFLRTLSSR